MHRWSAIQGALSIDEEDMPLLAFDLPCLHQKPGGVDMQRPLFAGLDARLSGIDRAGFRAAPVRPDCSRPLHIEGFVERRSSVARHELQ